jgi:hypothetical protein
LTRQLISARRPSPGAYAVGLLFNRLPCQGWLTLAAAPYLSWSSWDWARAMFCDGSPSFAGPSGECWIPVPLAPACAAPLLRSTDDSTQASDICTVGREGGQKLWNLPGIGTALPSELDTHLAEQAHDRNHRPHLTAITRVASGSQQAGAPRHAVQVGPSFMFEASPISSGSRSN